MQFAHWLLTITTFVWCSICHSLLMSQKLFGNFAGSTFGNGDSESLFRNQDSGLINHKLNLQLIPSRHEILRGIFHRINRVLFRKSQFFDLHTILYLTYYVTKKFKKPDLLGLWKIPLTIPCLIPSSHESKQDDHALSWQDDLCRIT